MLFNELDKGKPIQPQQGDAVQVARKADPAPSSRSVTLSGISGRVAAFARRFVVSGPAQVDAPNDWNQLPQFGMELRAVDETLHEMYGQSGVIEIDPNIANSFHVELSGPATIKVLPPDPLPDDQPQRARSRGINVAVYRNQHPLTFDSAILWDKGELQIEGGDGPDDLSFKINTGTQRGTVIFGYPTGSDFGPLS